MKRSTLGFSVVVLASAIALGGIGFSRAKPAPTPGGVDAELIGIPWLEGDWQNVVDAAMTFSIERRDDGVYELSSDHEAWQRGSELRVFRAGRHRVAEMRLMDFGTVYATVDGHSQRLSMNVVPVFVPFPDAWESKQILSHLGLDDEPVVPMGARVDAVARLADLIDTRGTLMHQDYTFYRDGWDD